MTERNQLGGCRLERVQSRSVHSDLYRAYSEELHRQVMIKVLSPRFPPNSRTAKRFVRGGRLAMELEHPNIVRTFSSGDDRGRPYMLMEFVDGHNLERILDVREKLPWELALGIIRQAAKALDAASQKGIVHRAIEPSHLMLSPGGRVTVLGFGLARQAETEDMSITQEGALVNVTAYSPPESGWGTPDIRGDLYSLGCVLYHLVAGRPPFEARDPLQMLHLHRTEEYWPVEDLMPDLPESAVAIIGKLLEKKAEDRIASPRDLIALVDAAIQPELLGARGIKPDHTMVATTMEMLALRERYTILVCDDQESVLHCMHETLRRLGLTVLTARSGRAALEAVEARKPHLILTDLKVPAPHGRDLLEAIVKVAPECSIILTRTGAMAEQYYRMPDLHVAACLPRPLDLFLLRRTVQGCLDDA